MEIKFKIPDKYEFNYEVKKFTKGLEIIKKRNEFGIYSLIIKNQKKGEKLDFYDYSYYHGIISPIISRIYNVNNPESQYIDGVPERFLREEHLTMSSAQDFLDWYTNTYELKAEELSDSLLSLNFNKNATELDKMKKIYKYVQDEIRYIANMKDNHGYYPHKPSEVLKNGFGDCKDMAFLLQSIAAKYGVTAYPVLVSTRFQPQFDYPHPESYNHAINAFKYKDKFIFVDPTYDNMNFGSLPDYLINKKGFILDRNAAQFVTLEQENDPLKAKITINGKIDSLKSCTAEIRLYNDYLAATRDIKKKSTKLQLENFLNNTLNNHFRKISLDYFDFVDEKEDHILFQAKADLSKYLIETSKNIYIPQNPFLYSQNKILERDDDKPIQFSKLWNTKLNINLETDKKVDSDFFEIGKEECIYFQSKAVNNDGLISIDYSMSLQKLELYGKTKEIYLSTLRDFFKSKKNMYIVKKEL